MADKIEVDIYIPEPEKDSWIEDSQFGHEADCPCCGREVQYAICETNDGHKYFVDAAECNLWPAESGYREEYPEVMPADDADCILVYGVLIPQWGSADEDWDEKLKKFYNHQNWTIVDDQNYASCYHAFKLFPELRKYPHCTPVALIMQTELPLTKIPKKFGYTASLFYQNCDIPTMILNRPYLLSLFAATEKIPFAEFMAGTSNWEALINRNLLERIAARCL